jgi:hypothetical protein
MLLAACGGATSAAPLDHGQTVSQEPPTTTTAEPEGGAPHAFDGGQDATDAAQPDAGQPDAGQSDAAQSDADEETQPDADMAGGAPAPFVDGGVDAPVWSDGGILDAGSDLDVALVPPDTGVAPAQDAAPEANPAGDMPAPYDAG